MASTYSGDPRNSEKDRVRFLLGATKEPWLFTDEEIAYTLEENGSAYGAASELATIKATELADKRDKAVGPLRISYGEASDRWLKVATNLRHRSGRTSGAVAITTQKSRSPHFKLGGMDNGVSNLPDLKGENVT